jgi:outer membrane protein assembly factor BamD
MLRKILVSAALAGALLVSSGCHHKVQNPLANIDSKQPDKGLFDRAMDSMKHGRYQEARTLLDTLINTYPDSEYIARAKLALGDAWYDEGGKAAWQEAEAQYKDFITFFPNLPEASEAQLKIATMHFRQIEKPDRDYTEAERAAEEYRTLVQQFPDSPLVPQAKQKLREVQEILAERQFRIAHFYYLRDNLAASQARLESLIESYPLYSNVDEALFELGQLYEKEAAGIKKQPKISAAIREKLVAQFEKKAIDAYSKIITRYPAMERVGDAKRRLEALNAPVPEPTPEALAESKAEESSREKLKLVSRVTGNFKKRPDVTIASKVGEPNLNDEVVESAPAIVNNLTAQMNGLPAPPVQPATAATSGTQASQSVGVEAVGSGNESPAPNESAPSSANTPSAPSGSTGAAAPNGSAAANSTAAGSGAGTANPTEGAPPPQAPAQVNEIQKPTGEGVDVTKDPASGQQKAGKVDKKSESSSKKKKKKGLGRLNPF